MSNSFWFDFEALSDHDASDAGDPPLRSQDLDEATEGQAPQFDCAAVDAEMQLKVTGSETEEQSSQTNCSMESALIETDASENSDRSDGHTCEPEAREEVDSPMEPVSSKEIDPHAMPFAQRRAMFEPTQVEPNTKFSPNISDGFNLDDCFRGEVGAGDVEQLCIEENFSSNQFFDWDILPDLVLSQRERGLLGADEVTTTRTLSGSGTSTGDACDVWLCCDADGHPRGRCENCKNCESFVLTDHSYICWEEGIRLMDHPYRCERCNCNVSDHETSPTWLTLVRTALKRLRDTGTNTKQRRPTRSHVPVVALHWEPTDVALYVLTEGVFDPRRDGRPKQPEAVAWCKEGENPADAEMRPLVSIITPTSTSRQAFHPLLYECFRTQQYEPKELIVVETGDAPSQFLQERARQDPRIVYRFWPVDDARMQDLSETVMEEKTASRLPATKGSVKGGNGKGGRGWLWPDLQKQTQFPDNENSQQQAATRLKLKLRGKVRGGKRQEGWTLGMKRNIACNLARGDVIAHFDDDDLYAPIYLSQMVPKLQEAARYRPVNGRLPAAAVTLESWHVLDLADQTFGFFTPKAEDLLSRDMRDCYAYGFGFSYVYSKAAWDMQAFADVEWSEDGQFTVALMAKQRPVRLVHPRSLGTGIDAVAAHSHHRDTTSGGEFSEVTYTEYGTHRHVTKAVRMGKKVGIPKELAGLLPLIRSIASEKKFNRSDVHPIRLEVTLNPARGEVGLGLKQDFMRKYGSGLGESKWSPQQWTKHMKGKGTLQWPLGKGGGKGNAPGPSWSKGTRPSIPQPPSIQRRI